MNQIRSLRLLRLSDKVYKNSSRSISWTLPRTVIVTPCLVQGFTQITHPFSTMESPVQCKDEILDMLRVAQTNRQSPKGAMDALEQTIEVDESDKMQLQELIFASWIRRQQDLIEVFTAKRKAKTLKEACEAAHYAHEMLGTLHPFLSYKLALNDGRLTDEDLSTTQAKTVVTRCNAVIGAWVAVLKAERDMKSKNAHGACHRAQFILERMERLSRAKPDLDTYNQVMEAWAYGKEPYKGSRAVAILEKLERAGWTPSAQSYSAIITAWASSRERRCAYTATSFLKGKLRLVKEGVYSMAPTLDDYKEIFKAWRCSEHSQSPFQAIRILEILEQSHSNGRTDVLPDYECLRYVLDTVASRHCLAGMGDIVDKVLRRMDDRFMIPDTHCYAAAIRAWRWEAQNPNRCQPQDVCCERVLQLLSKMKDSDNQSRQYRVRPTTEIFNNVLETLTLVLTPRNVEHAEQILLQMEDAMKNGEREQFPTARSYMHVIRIMRALDASTAIDRAGEVLERFQQNIEKLGTDKDSLKPFNSYMAVCCWGIRSKKVVDKIDVFQRVFRAFESIRKTQGLTPNGGSYRALLSLCGRSTPPSSEKKLMAERIFRLCCDAGMVSHRFLLCFVKVAEPDQYLKLVVSRAEEVEGKKIIPAEWSRNLSRRKIRTAEGWKTRPLGIDGRLLVTRAMEDYRLRRLRDHRNRDLLRGGRLPSDKAI